MTEAASPSVSVDEGSALARMVAHACENWGLDTDESLSILGLGPQDTDPLCSYRQGEPLADDREVLDRISWVSTRICVCCSRMTGRKPIAG